MTLATAPMIPGPERIGIVGAGAVAQTLGRALVRANLPVVALASRTPEHAARAAAFVGGGVRVVDTSALPSTANHILIATTDVAIRPTAEALVQGGMTEGVVIHTCAGCGLDALAPLQSRRVSCGVMHPLETFTGTDTAIEGIRYAVAGDREAAAWASRLSRQLDGRALMLAADALPLYHAGAVLASNGFAALVDGALTTFVAAGVDRDEALLALAPLCRQALTNILTVGPEQALTGPIVRGDVATVVAHQSALAHRTSSLLPLYRAISAALVEMARRRGLPEATVRTLSAMFE